MIKKVTGRLFFPLLGAAVLTSSVVGLGSAVRAETGSATKATLTTEPPVKVKALTRFVKPIDPRGEAKAKAAFNAHIAKKGPIPAPKVDRIAKTRGALVNRVYSGRKPYWGIGEFVYYNNDGAESKDWFGKIQKEDWRSCGQAAAATMLRYWKAIPEDNSDNPVRDLYNKYPADGYLGIAGTSWQRINSMLKDKGLSTAIYQGETALRNSVGNGKPAIVLLDISAFSDWDYKWGGHWVVVYGYTDNNVYLSNWNKDYTASWEEFRKGWINNNIVNGGGFSERLLVASGSRGHR